MKNFNNYHLDLLNSTDTLSDFFNGLECQDNGEALEGVYLGSFVHDYERSTQNYNVAIKGLDHDDVAIIDFNGSLDIRPDFKL